VEGGGGLGVEGRTCLKSLERFGQGEFRGQVGNHHLHRIFRQISQQPRQHPRHYKTLPPPTTPARPASPFFSLFLVPPEFPHHHQILGTTAPGAASFSSSPPQQRVVTKTTIASKHPVPGSCRNHETPPTPRSAIIKLSTTTSAIQSIRHHASPIEES